MMDTRHSGCGGPTVEPTFGGLVKSVVFDTAIYMRRGVRGTHHVQGLSPETGYVDADQHAVQFYPCRRGGPYVYLARGRQ